MLRLFSIWPVGDPSGWLLHPSGMSHHSVIITLLPSKGVPGLPCASFLALVLKLTVSSGSPGSF